MASSELSVDLSLKPRLDPASVQALEELALGLEAAAKALRGVCLLLGATEATSAAQEAPRTRESHAESQRTIYDELTSGRPG
jgi:hypothetical protein